MENRDQTRLPPCVTCCRGQASVRTLKATETTGIKIPETVICTTRTSQQGVVAPFFQKM